MGVVNARASGVRRSGLSLYSSPRLLSVLGRWGLLCEFLPSHLCRGGINKSSCLLRCGCTSTRRGLQSAEHGSWCGVSSQETLVSLQPHTSFLRGFGLQDLGQAAPLRASVSLYAKWKSYHLSWQVADSGGDDDGC